MRKSRPRDAVGSQEPFFNAPVPEAAEPEPFKIVHEPRTFGAPATLIFVGRSHLLCKFNKLGNDAFFPYVTNKTEAE